MRITSSLLQKIVRFDLKTELLSSKDLTKGWDHRVFLLNTKKGKFVIRLPRKDLNKIRVQAWACRQLAKKGVPVPHPIVEKPDYLIETYIAGKNAKKLIPSQRKRYHVQLAKCLKKMHSVKMTGFGVLNSFFIGNSRSWYDCMAEILADLDVCVHDKKLTAGEAEVIRNEASSCIPYFKNYMTPVLLHGDLYRDNTMIFKGNLSGIIDAADAFSGDPLYDFGVIYSEEFDWEVILWMEQAYGPLDRHLIWTYALLISVWLLRLVDKPMMVRGIQRRIRDLLQKRF